MKLRKGLYVASVFILGFSSATYSADWLTGLKDSTRVPSIGGGFLWWQAGAWSSCSAPAASCGVTSGSQSRTVLCKETLIKDNSQRTAIREDLCTTITNSLGEKPATSRACTRNFGACPPPPPPPPPITPPTTGGGTVTTRGSISYSQADACWSVCSSKDPTRKAQCLAKHPNFLWGGKGSTINIAQFKVTLPDTLTSPSGAKVIAGVISLSHNPAPSCPSGKRETSYKFSSTETNSVNGFCHSQVPATGTRATIRTCQ